ncbi:MAG: sporulation transcription factor Spo0A [Clostridia bacterium]|nr:sporulation transcription factor Spo0A [Clostridia bacterium]
MKTKILVIDDNKEYAEQLAKSLTEAEDLEVIATAQNGEEGLKIFNTYRPDVVILDLVMPVRDGYSFLENAHKGNSKFIALSALSQDAFINRAITLGADYYLVKPCSAKVVEERIRFVRNGNKETVVDKAIEERITNIFITVGIPAHIKGYQFLREAIKMAVDNPEVINSITKQLYPSVAKRFSTSASKVERAIRHAIEVAWNRGKIENINSLFGVKVYNHNEKPTNGEFIALVADKMLLESV